MREVECAALELVDRDVVLSQFDVRMIGVEPPRVDVGDDHVTVGSRALAKPAGDRAAPAADLEARPPGGDPDSSSWRIVTGS